MLEVFLLTFSSEKPLNDDNVVEKVGWKECEKSFCLLFLQKK